MPAPPTQPRTEPPTPRAPGRYHPNPRGEPLRFSLGAIFVGITLVAVSLALTKQWGVLGFLPVWLVALLFTVLTWTRETSAIRAIRWLLWGVLLPLLWLMSEQFMHGESLLAGETLLERMRAWSNFQWWFYTFCLGEMLAMTIWVLFSRSLPRLKAFFTGMFVAAAIVAGFPGFFLGGFLVLYAISGPADGNWQNLLGLLYLTPFFTAVAYFQAFNAAGKQALAELTDTAVFFFLLFGLATSVLAPLLVAIAADLVLPG